MSIRSPAFRRRYERPHATPSVTRLVVASAALAFAASTAHADERSQIRVLRAQQLAAQGRCEQVLELLRDTERADRPAGLEVTAAQCEIRLERYDEAIVRLESLEDVSPGTPDAALFLGVARYHDGDLQGAARALERARGNTDDEAQLELYTGMVLLQQAQTREAALALERARRSDSTRVEPVASYYALLAWQAEGERERAEDALARVQRVDPDGRWASQAAEVLAAGRAPAPPEREWWLRAEAGLEYDSNVALVADNPDGLVGIPNVPQTAGLPSEQDDVRAVWSIDGGVGLFRGERWSVWALAGYAGTAHFNALFSDKNLGGVRVGLDADDFDTHQLYGGARLDHLIGDAGLFRWEVDYRSWWVNGIPKDDYLQRYRSTKYLTQNWGDGIGSSQLQVGLFLDDIKFSERDVFLSATRENETRDRDGWGVVAGAQHRVPLGFQDAALTGGYTLTHKIAKGSEYDYLAHEIFAAYAMSLPYAFAFNWRGGITFQDFDGRSSFPDATMMGDLEIAGRDQREDRIYNVLAGLSRPITRHLSASARYSFTKANSNTKVFRYDRHVVGAYLTLNFP